MKKLMIASLIGMSSLSQHALAADIKLGFLATQSGPLAILGAEQKRGFDLAVEHLGGKMGPLNIAVFGADSKGNPNTAVQEASKLVERDKVDVITGGTASNEIMAVVKPITASGTLFIGSNGGPSPLAGKACNKNYFSAAFQNDQWSEGMGKYMAKQGYKRVYFIAMDYQAGRDHVDGALRGYGAPAMQSVFTPQAQLDFSAEIAQIRAAKPDAVFAFYAGGPAIAFVKQYAQAGLSKTIPLLSNMGLADTLFFGALNESALGLTVSGHYAAALDNPANRKFVADFRKKYSRDPSTYAAQQYDAVMLINSAVVARKGDLSDKNALREAVRAANFQSVRGGFKFNVNHMPIQNIYATRVERKEGGELYMKVLGTASEQATDAYYKDCSI
jgi:branched-chain amino acid transport system substrate-binding protein